MVNEAEKHVLLRSATLVAYPSRYEGFGFPMLEAMQVGAPVVSTAVGSIPEVAGGAAVLVPDDDEAALTEAIGALLDDPERREALAAAGRERVAEYSWADTAQGLIEVYTRITRQDVAS